MSQGTGRERSNFTNTVPRDCWTVSQSPIILSPLSHGGMRLVKPTSLVLSCTNLLRRSSALSAGTRSLRLCAFRGRSRHTSGFEPFETFELPPQELIASAEPIGSERYDLRLQPTQGSSVFQWVHSSMGNTELADAASRCVLLHGLFEVWGHGRNQEEAAKDATRSGRFLPSVEASSWSLGITSYGRSNLSKAEQKALVSGPVEEFLFTSLKGRRTESLNSDIRIRVIEDNCPPPAGNLPQDVRKRAEAAAETRREKMFYICRELQIGAAVSEGGTVLATACGRRPIRGVLGELALNRRMCRGPTPIEPEVALVMANLAKVRPGSRVLDPFCGCCSLLLPAARMGAETWGSDVSGPATAAAACPDPQNLEKTNTNQTGAPLVNESVAGQGRTGDGTLPQADDREDLKDLYRDFKALGLTPPMLVEADVRDEESRVRRPRFYDAIITDPPYNIKAKVFATNDGPNSTLLGAEATTTEGGYSSPSSSSSSVAARLDYNVDAQQSKRSERKGAEYVGASGSAQQWKAGDGARAVAHANGLVGEVIWSLLSLARCSLKPGGRLCFFLPLRGAEARLDTLPSTLVERLSEGDEAEDEAREGGRRLSLVYATKQRMTSPNMSRWLLVLEKEKGDGWGNDSV